MGNKVVVNSHQAFERGPIDAISKLSEEWLVRGINEGRIVINIEQIIAARQEREREQLQNRYEALLAQIGFDPLDVEASDAAYYAWHHSLRSIFPESDRKEYLLSRGVDSFVEQEVAIYSSRKLRYG